MEQLSALWLCLTSLQRSKGKGPITLKQLRSSWVTLLHEERYSAAEDSTDGSVHANYHARWADSLNSVALEKNVEPAHAEQLAVRRKIPGMTGCGRKTPSFMRSVLKSSDDGQLIPRRVSGSLRYSLEADGEATGPRDTGFDCKTEIHWLETQKLAEEVVRAELEAYVEAEGGSSRPEVRRSAALSSSSLLELEPQPSEMKSEFSRRSGQRDSGDAVLPRSAALGAGAKPVLDSLLALKPEDPEESLRQFVELGKLVRADAGRAVLLSRFLLSDGPALESKLVVADVLATSREQEVTMELLRPLSPPEELHDPRLARALLKRVLAVRRPGARFLGLLEELAERDAGLLLLLSALVHRHGVEGGGRGSDGEGAVQAVRATLERGAGGPQRERYLAAIAAGGGVDALLPWLAAADSVGRAAAFQALRWVVGRVTEAQAKALVRQVQCEGGLASTRAAADLLRRTGWHGEAKSVLLSSAPERSEPWLPSNGDEEEGGGSPSVLRRRGFKLPPLSFERAKVGRCQRDVQIGGHTQKPFWDVKAEANLCNTVQAAMPTYGADEFDLQMDNEFRVPVTLFGFKFDLIRGGMKLRYQSATHRGRQDAVPFVDRLLLIEEEIQAQQRQRAQSSPCAAALRSPSNCCERWRACDSCDSKGEDWAGTLPQCPCRLEEVCGAERWCSCDASQDVDCARAEECFTALQCGDGWHEEPQLLSAWRKREHGAAVCIAASAGGHAQRCCYDAHDALITWGPGAGTPARFDPREDYAGHQQREFLGAVDCGLLASLHDSFFDSRPPASHSCPRNPAVAPTASPRGPGLERDLGQCAVQDWCGVLCETGGIAAPACPASEFEARLFFDGADLALARKGKFARLWPAHAAPPRSRPEEQDQEGGPLPEGRWWLVPSADGVELFPCCGTLLRERRACKGSAPRGDGAAAPCRSRFTISASDEGVGIVVDPRTLAEVRGLGSAILLVDYAHPVRQRKLTSTRTPAFLELMGQDVSDPHPVLGLISSFSSLLGQSRSGSGKNTKVRDVSKLMRKKKPSKKQKQDSKARRCQEGPHMFRTCKKDTDCGSSRALTTADKKQFTSFRDKLYRLCKEQENPSSGKRPSGGRIRRQRRGGRIENIRNRPHDWRRKREEAKTSYCEKIKKMDPHKSGKKRHACAAGTAWKKALYLSGVHADSGFGRFSSWAQGVDDQFWKYAEEEEEPEYMHVVPGWCSIECTLGWPMINIGISVECGVKGRLDTEVDVASGPGPETGIRAKAAPSVAMEVTVRGSATLLFVRGSVEARFTLLETGLDMRVEMDLSRGAPIQVCPSMSTFTHPLRIEVWAHVEIGVWFWWETLFKVKIAEVGRHKVLEDNWPSCFIESKAPSALNLKLVTEEDTAVTGLLQGKDARHRKLQFTLGADAFDRQQLHGTVQVLDHNKGSFVFHPDPDFAGSVAFSFDVFNGLQRSNTGTVRINVRSEPDLPLVSASSVRGDEDEEIPLSLFAASIDVDGSERCTFKLSHITKGYRLCIDGTCMRWERWFEQRMSCEVLRAPLALQPLRDAELDSTVVFTVWTRELDLQEAARERSEKFGVTVEAVNDAPTLAAPQELSVREDSFVDFGVSVADVDARAGALTVRISAAKGALSLPLHGEGAAECLQRTPSQIQCTAQLQHLNLLLQRLRYAPDEDYFGEDQVRISVEDNGNSGKCPQSHDKQLYEEGRPCSLSASIATEVAVCAVNDPPVVHLPPVSDFTILASEDYNPPLIFQTSVSDIDAGDHLMTVKIELLGESLGDISLPNAPGRDLEVCDVDSTACYVPTARPSSNSGLLVRATQRELNAVLAAVRFDVDLSRSVDTCGQIVSITVDDEGIDGACVGEPLSDTKKVSVSVFKENRAPELKVDAAPLEGLFEGGAAVLDGRVVVHDVDASLGRIFCSLRCTRCRLLLNECPDASSCMVSTEQDGADWVASIAARLVDVQFVLQNVTLVAATHSSGLNVALAILVDDAGNTGFGGPRSVQELLTVQTRQVADPPALEVLSAYTVAAVRSAVPLLIDANLTDTAESLSVLIFVTSRGEMNETVQLDCEAWCSSCGSCAAPRNATSPSGCFTLSSSTAGTVVYGNCSAELTVSVRATSTTPDGADRADRDETSIVDFVAPDVQVVAESTRPWICARKVDVDSPALLSQCRGSTLEIEVTAGSAGGVLILSGQELRLQGTGVTHVQLARAPHAAHSISFLRSAQTRVAFHASWNPPFSTAVVNGVPWEGVQDFRRSLALPDAFLEQQPGEPFPANLSVSVLHASCGGAPCDASRWPRVLQTPSLDNSRTTSIGLPPWQQGAAVSFSLVFDAPESSYGCCVKRFEYAASSAVPLPSIRVLRQGDAVGIEVQRCEESEPACERALASNAARCRWAGAEAPGVFDADRGVVSCTIPQLQFKSESAEPFLRETFTPDIAFGSGIWTTSGHLVTVYDANRKPTIVGPDPPTVLFCRTGEEVVVAGFRVRDDDFAIPRFDSFPLSFQAVAGRGAFVVNGSSVPVARLHKPLYSLNEELGAGLVYRCPSKRGEDSVELLVDDLGVAGLGGNLLDRVQISVVVVPSSPQPRVHIPTISELAAQDVWSIYEVTGSLASEVEAIPESENALPITAQFCTVTNDELGYPLSYPCVLYIPHVQVEVDEDDSDDDFRVTVTAQKPSGWVEVQEFDGMVGSSRGQEIEFSGSLAQINVALSALSYRTFVEDSCTDVVSIRVEAAVPCPREDAAEHTRSCHSTHPWTLHDASTEFDEIAVDLGEKHQLVMVEFDVPAGFDPSGCVLAMETSDRAAPFATDAAFDFLVSNSSRNADMQTVALRVDRGVYTVDFAAGAQFWRLSVPASQPVAASGEGARSLKSMKFWYGGPWSWNSLDMSTMPVNDAPEWEYAALSLQGLEDTPLSLSGFSVVDPDASVVVDGILLVTISVDPQHGAVAVARELTQHSSTSATLVEERQDAAAGTLELLATLQGCNDAVATLQFHPAKHWHGQTTVRMTVMDRANFGWFGRRSRTIAVDLVVIPVNDAPRVLAPATLLLAEAEAFAFAGAATVEDPDLTGGLELEVSAEVGVLYMKCKRTPLAVPSKRHTCTGSLSELNEALLTLKYHADKDASGADVVSFRVDDLANGGLRIGGVGGALSMALTVAVTVRGVADKPVLVIDDRAAGGQCERSQPRGWGWRYGVLSSKSQQGRLRPTASPLCHSSCGPLQFSRDTSLAFGVLPFPLQRARVFGLSHTTRLSFAANSTAPFAKQDQAPRIELVGAEDSSVCLDALVATSDTDGSERTTVALNTSEGLASHYLSSVTRPTHLSFLGSGLSESEARSSVVSLYFGRVGAANSSASSSAQGAASALLHGNTTQLRTTAVTTLAFWLLRKRPRVVLSRPEERGWSAPTSSLESQVFSGLPADRNGVLDGTLRLSSEESNSDTRWISHPVRLSFLPVNDKPTIETPSTVEVPEDRPILLRGIMISDPDAAEYAQNSRELELSVLHGTLNLTGATNASINCSQPVSTFCSVTGSLSDLNSVLANLRYVGFENENGLDMLRLRLTEEDAKTSAVQQVDAVVEIDVVPVNDPILVRLGNWTSSYNTTEEDWDWSWDDADELEEYAWDNSTVSTQEDTQVRIPAFLIDVDLADDPYHDYVVVVSATNGAVSVTADNVTYVAGAPQCMDPSNRSDASTNETNSSACGTDGFNLGSVLTGNEIEFMGSFEWVVAALQTLTYTPGEDFYGHESVVITVRDQDCCGVADFEVADGFDWAPESLNWTQMSANWTLDGYNWTEVNSSLLGGTGGFDYLEGVLTINISVLPVEDPPTVVILGSAAPGSRNSSVNSTQWIAFSVFDPDGEDQTVEVQASVQSGWVFLPTERSDCSEAAMTVDDAGALPDTLGGWEGRLGKVVTVRAPLGCIAEIGEVGYVADGEHVNDVINISVAAVVDGVASSVRSRAGVGQCFGFAWVPVKGGVVSCTVGCDPAESEWDCCTPASPCFEGEGDCDEDADCAPGLKCGMDNWQTGHAIDLCYRPHCDPAEMDWDCCTVSNPCLEGQGDCDDDSECAPGLQCGSDNGQEGQHLDLCSAPADPASQFRQGAEKEIRHDPSSGKDLDNLDNAQPQTVGMVVGVGCLLLAAVVGVAVLVRQRRAGGDENLLEAAKAEVRDAGLVFFQVELHKPSPIAREPTSASDNAAGQVPLGEHQRAESAGN